MTLESWGRVPPANQKAHWLQWASEPLPDAGGLTMLPYGLGRSYGDSCLNHKGLALVTPRMDKFLSFDQESGLLECEAGVSFDTILDVFVPRGWFLPVTPGTRYVTVGGAIANDVHGKNHHRSGTFGEHVEWLELLRPDLGRLRCSATENAALFRATIGGLGLTGLITRAAFKLKRIANPWIDMETIPFANVDKFFELAAESDKRFDYTVSWVDCIASGSRLGRGIYMGGNNAATAPAKNYREPRRAVPFDFPSFALNGLTVRAFNTTYHAAQSMRAGKSTVHYKPFFYPLDAVKNWNRIYGRRGFHQHQCVVPFAGSHEPIRRILEAIAESRQGSFLAVLKICGKREPAGMLSFPMEGVTLALDFAHCGESTSRLLHRLDDITLEAGGRTYPAKDGRIDARHFQSFYPNWREFSAHIAPGFSSDFWKRVSAPF